MSKSNHTDNPAVRAWVALLRAQATALGAVQAELKAAGFPPLEWYDVMWELERGGPLRPREVQARLLLAQYNLSRLIDRMGREGLLERRPCPEDRRGQLVMITQAGKVLRARMWPVYRGAIDRAVGCRLEAEEATNLARLLGHLTG